MYKKSEQFSELQRKNMETGIKLAKISIDSSQRIVALQVEVAKQLLQDSIENAKALVAVKDPQQAVTLQTRFAQETTKKMMEIAHEIAEISSASRAEFSHLLTEQLASGSKEMVAAFQSLFTAFPGQDSNVMDAMKQAMTTATGAFEQFAQASSVFTKTAGAKKTSTRKK